MLDEINQLYEGLPSGYNGEDFSRGAAFTYGEVTADALRVLLKRCQELREHQEIDCFLDLGSGCGRTVLHSLVLQPQIRRSIGIELSMDRHKTAMKARKQLSHSNPDMADRAVLVNADAQFAVAAVASADVIWVSNTCFPEELNRRIAYLIDTFARPGALVCSTIELPCVRKNRETSETVEMPLAWQELHHALVHRVTGPSPGSFAEIDHTFTVWAIRGQGASILVKFIELVMPLFLVVGSLVGTIATFVLNKARMRDLDLEAGTTKAPSVLRVQFLVPAISAALLARQLDPDNLLDALFGSKPSSGSIGPVLAQAEKDYHSGLDLETFKRVCATCDAVAKQRYGNI